MDVNLDVLLLLKEMFINLFTMRNRKIWYDYAHLLTLHKTKRIKRNNITPSPSSSSPVHMYMSSPHKCNLYLGSNGIKEIPRCWLDLYEGELFWRDWNKRNSVKIIRWSRHIGILYSVGLKVNTLNIKHTNVSIWYSIVNELFNFNLIYKRCADISIHIR